jgi:hypothetical protein
MNLQDAKLAVQQEKLLVGQIRKLLSKLNKNENSCFFVL